jgi:nucleoside-diphosphate-sugar epimerase
MRILLTGITGAIGSAILKTLSTTSHEVICWVRDAEKGQAVISQYGPNISLHVADPSQDTETQFYTAARDCQGIIHSGFFVARPGYVELEQAVIAGVLRAARETAQHSPVHFVFTTGCLCTGNNPGLMTEEDALQHPESAAPFVKPRFGHEQAALAGNSDNIFVAVARPACVYGGSSIDLYFRAVKASGKIVVTNGNRANRLSYVHKEDLGEFYKQLVEHDARGMFHISEGPGPTVEEFIELVRTLTGVQEVEPLENPWAKYNEYGFLLVEFPLNMLIDSKRGREELAWVPKHNFTRDAPVDLILS